MKTIFLFAAYLLFAASFAFAQNAPQTIVFNGETLLRNRTAAEKGDAITVIAKQAEKIVKAGKLYSVMDKEQIPPSGDKHDYMSQAPYWWADPSKPNGLPYIRRDGERNPELNKISDTAEMDDLIEDAETTAIAYFFTKNDAMAEHSAKLIKTWFLDPKTRQNPNLNFGQGIPGINKGRGIGIIETRELYRIIDAAILLKGSKSWSESDEQGLKKWFADYTKWMLESDLGKDEADELNNHGTHYDVQIIAFTVFTGNSELAKKQIEVAKSRIKSQLAADGSQPHELARTLSWGYTNMNLLGFLRIARLAENQKIDLWNFETADKKSLKKAVEWLIPFVKDEKKWTYQQIKPATYEKTEKILRIAAEKYGVSEYNELADKLKIEPFQTAIQKLTH